MQKNVSPTIVARLIISALFTAVIAGTWDAWWHGAIGRDSVFIPPHLLLYASTTIAILLGIYGWYVMREEVWRRMAIILVIVPLTAPFDELWHRLFGIENISNPLIVWAPPHIAIIVSLTIAFCLLLPLLKRDPNVMARQLFGAMIFAGILSLLSFLLGPVAPIGPWHLLGFWGAGIFVALYVAVLLKAEQWMPELGSLTLVTILFLLLQAMSFGEKIAPGVVIVPHDHPPGWLTIFAFLIPAVLADSLKKLPRWARGGLLGFLSALILYGFSSRFFEPQFQYSALNAWQAIIASLAGGVVVGEVIQLSQK